MSEAGKTGGSVPAAGCGRASGGGARGRNGEIDLMRVAMAVVIMVFHARFFWGKAKIPPFANGVYAVDFFLLLSGLLMAKSIASGRAGDTFAFLKRKLSSFYLVFVSSALIAGVAFCMSRRLSAGESAVRFLSDVFEFLLVGHGGLQPFTGFNAVSWYLSAMMLAMAVLHPVASRFRHWFFPVGSVLVAACCYGVLLQNCGGVTGGRNWTGFCTYRMVRAVASISLGVFVFEMADRTRNSVRATKTGCLFFNLLKVLAAVMFFAILFHPRHGVIARLGKMDGFVCMLFFALYLYLSFSGLAEFGWLRRIPLGWCGPASLYIFLNHYGVLHVLNRNFICRNGLPVRELFALLVLGTTVSCLLCAAMVALFRRIGRAVSPLLLVRGGGDAESRNVARRETGEAQ